MEKETSPENPSLLPPNNNSNNNIGNSSNVKNESPRKQLGVTGGGGSNDRLKRDEWSEGAVSSLLEAYENKWVLRNRAKLKGHDWEDVARHVSSRANCAKSHKTQTQCKNKIESMKKRYRSESATAEVSTWPLYSRLDHLLRGSSTATAQVTVVSTAAQQTPQPIQQQLPQFSLPISSHLVLLEPPPVVQQPSVAAVPPIVDIAQNSHDSNGVDKEAKEVGVEIKLSDHGSDKNAMDTDSSTPAVYSENEKLMTRKHKRKMEKKKKRKREEFDIADSIRWLAEAVVKSEQAKMETMRELEKMRIEAETKRGEMDLKRTEIIANTQLEIAKIFAGVNKGVDSSLRIGRN